MIGGAIDFLVHQSLFQFIDFLINPTQQMETTKGTLFGTYNAVTGYFQNVKIYKYTEAEFKSIMTGNALGRIQATFDLCSDFVKVGVNALN